MAPAYFYLLATRSLQNVDYSSYLLPFDLSLFLSYLVIRGSLWSVLDETSKVSKVEVLDFLVSCFLRLLSETAVFNLKMTYQYAVSHLQKYLFDSKSLPLVSSPCVQLLIRTSS